MSDENKTYKEPLQMLKFAPIFRSVRWGGKRLAEYKRLNNLKSDNIGESWEISGLEGSETVVSEGVYSGKTVTELLKLRGAEILGPKLYARFGNFFPILIKFIDAEDDLSIQVHPGNENAPGGLGKNELWYIIKADAGSYIYSGFNRPLERERLTQIMDSGELVNVLAKHVSSPGDVYYLPAGRIHSIGGGNLLLEVQQTSGITYRLHDYNRLDSDGKPRELHVDQALDVIDYNQTDYGLARPQMLIDCETIVKTTPYFTVTSVQVIDRIELKVAAYNSPRIIVSIAGAGKLTDNNGYTTTIKQGETVLVPASIETVSIKATSTPLKIVTVYIE